jgi:hypothetical protein
MYPSAKPQTVEWSLPGRILRPRSQTPFGNVDRKALFRRLMLKRTRTEFESQIEPHCGDRPTGGRPSFGHGKRGEAAASTSRGHGNGSAARAVRAKRHDPLVVDRRLRGGDRWGRLGRRGGGGILPALVHK